MFEKPTLDDLRAAANKLGMTPSEDYLRATLEITAPLAGAYALLDELPDELPPVEYPREAGTRVPPENNPLGAWTYRTSIKGAAAEMISSVNGSCSQAHRARARTTGAGSLKARTSRPVS